MPFFDTELSKAIMTRTKLHNNFLQNKSEQNRKLYAKQRHLCVSLLRKVKKRFFFFSVWVFFHDHLRITEQQGKKEGISFTPHCHFHPLRRHLDISRVNTAESSPLHIGRSRT